VEALHTWPAGHVLVPVQTPPLQTSLVVHARPSLHDAVFAGCVHDPALHTSFVHGLPSLAHTTLLFVWVHVPLVHASFVHGFESLHWLALVHDVVVYA